MHESSQAYDQTFSYTSAWIAYMIGIADGFLSDNYQNQTQINTVVLS
jgi:hypothetical protein